VGPEVKRHAKKALWSHFIPLVVLFVGVITTVILGINGWEHFAVSLIVIYALFGILALVVVIWYIVKGIYVIEENHEITDYLQRFYTYDKDRIFIYMNKTLRNPRFL